jgi:hypothetical protein
MAKKAKDKSSANARRDVPKEDHIGRHCNHQRLICDIDTKNIVGVFPEAFHLRTEKKEEYLSVHWLEYFKGTLNTQFKGVVAALRDKRNVGRSSAIARLHVDLVLKAGLERNPSL